MKHTAGYNTNFSLTVTKQSKMSIDFNSSTKYHSLQARASSAAVRQPKEVAHFSRDKNYNYHLDRSSLKYYYLPDASIEAGINLDKGYESWVRSDEANVKPVHLDGILLALKKYELLTNNKEPIKVDFITFRGVMSNILCLPYANDESFDFNIVYFDGQIFIEKDSELAKQKSAKEKAEPNPMLERFQYSGYKFETISTIPKPWSALTRDEIETSKKGVVNNIEQYCSLVRSGIGKTKTLLGGEVDAIWDYVPDENDPYALKDDILKHYVELKTSKTIGHPKQVVNFERKLFKAWAQSFLIGVRKIIYGFRDDSFQLKSVEIYETEKIPAMVKSSSFSQQDKKWNGVTALKFYASVLEWLKAEIPKDESKVWRLKYDGEKKALGLTEITDDNCDHRQQIIDEILLKEFKEWRQIIRGDL